MKKECKRHRPTEPDQWRTICSKCGALLENTAFSQPRARHRWEERTAMSERPDYAHRFALPAGGPQ